VHCPGELIHPDVVWVGDHEPAEAVDTRRAIADRVGDGDMVVVGPHFPDAVFRQFHHDSPTALTEVMAGVSHSSSPAHSSSA
jgi:hypothetical protein